MGQCFHYRCLDCGVRVCCKAIEVNELFLVKHKGHRIVYDGECDCSCLEWEE